MKKMFCVLAAAALALGAAACTDHSSAEVLVSYATMKVIEKGDTPDEQLARAAKIHDIATQAKDALHGETVTVSLIEAAVRRQVDRLDLSPADRFLADTLINQVAVEIEARVGTGLLEEEQRLKVSTVLDWVINATRYAGG